MDNVVCHFGGYATRNDLLCGDGRTIRKDAFKDCDGVTVPLIWNHDHNNPDAVLGHALLENREDGVYAYCTFNDTKQGKNSRMLVQHGDVRSLSIYANKLKQVGGDVVHGVIRELSLVLAGANPGAFIDFVLEHGEEGEDSLYANYDESAITIYHSDDKKDEEEKPEEKSEEKPEEKSEEDKEPEGEEKTFDHYLKVFENLGEEEKTACSIIIGATLEKAGIDIDALDDDKEENEDKSEEGGNNTMKQNVFEKDEVKEGAALSHSDLQNIVALAKTTGVGSLQDAIKLYADQNGTLAHGFDTESLVELLPDFKNLTPGAPEILRPDQSWVMSVINKIHKSPYSRVRTRQADARIAELKAKGYQNKGDQKRLTNNIELIGRSFDPQTIYIKDEIHRDDVIDITDFDYVNYVWSLMKDNMYETLALAALVGDGREVGDPDKINETHVRSVWNDDELYTIHADVDVEKARQEIQGSNTSANFSENYIYAEAIIMAALYAREKFKGSGRPDFYCEPHLVNVMLLARDLNGRRIYDSKADLAKALNVGDIIEIEQFAGKTRTTKDGKTKKLLGLFVNLADYQFGSTKGGEVTKFEDFDIDFNKHKYLMETRLSGALTKLFAAIALEEDVTDAE